MTADAAMAIAILMAKVSNFPWPDDGSKHEGWVQILAAPCNSDIPDDIAVATTARMLTEYSPEKLSPAQIVERCRSRPELPKKRRSLPPPEDASGPALRKIYFPRDNGKEHFPVAHPDEEERERMRQTYAAMKARAPEPRVTMTAELEQTLLALGRRMGLSCAHCGHALSDDDLLAYTRTAMDAGRRGEVTPPAIACEACEIPF